MTDHHRTDTDRKRAPFGSWGSPISPELLTRATPDIGELEVVGGDVWWAETRSDEGGRTTLVRCPEPSTVPQEMLPTRFSVRTKVYEYGGCAWTVTPTGDAYFVNDEDQRIYRLDPTGTVVGLGTHDPSVRYADLEVAFGERWLLAVREMPGETEPQHEIVLVDLEGEGDDVELVSGPDFVWNPRVSPDGRWLAWVQWSHPLMPWEGAELWLGSLGDPGEVRQQRRLAGGLGASVFQPEWSDRGTLYYMCESSGWWNVHSASPTEEGWSLDHCVPIEAEVGIYAPSGVIGIRRFCILPDESIIFAYIEDGTDRLAALPSGSDEIVDVPVRFSLITQVREAGTGVILAGSTFTSGPEVVRLQPDERGWQDAEEVTLRPAPDFGLEPEDLAIPESIWVPTRDRSRVHTFLYRPTNQNYAGLPSERPPLIVMSHGGPTDAASCALSLPIQYWTSRGFAVLDVNYRGSTGFGRDYREALNGRWGVLDVTDCLDATAAIVAGGEVDGSRVAIRGGSAGGYTTLCALVVSDIYAAGVSRYGVSDLRRLADETHKFESHLLDGLIGEYPTHADVYRTRSPVFRAGEISAPVLLVQGLEDTIVPPNQAELMISEFERMGTTYAYLPIPGEGHGLRSGKSIRLALETELAFYSVVFEFDLAGGATRIALANALMNDALS